MTGQLRDSDKSQIESWIGQGPKNFSLLYSISKDGCSAQKFHEKCDHQGSTITVIYNNQGSVFGGYTSASWAASISGSTRDDKAFLFQLKFSGTDTRRQFPISDAAFGIYSHPNFGPTFGEEAKFDLKSFSGTINNASGVFQLDGAFTFGTHFAMTGVSSWDEIHNGVVTVTDIEVYSVAVKQVTEEPYQAHWRKMPEWNRKLSQELLQEVKSLQPSPEMKLQDYRILLIGPVGAGKSSFCNTVNSVFRGRMTQRAICGEGQHSITTAYQPYVLNSKDNVPLHVRLCDTRGLEPNFGIETMEFSYLLNGHIPERYEFNAEKSISLDDPMFVLKPSLKDRPHCVVFVLDATTIGKLDEKLLEKIKNFRKSATRKQIPQAVLLTKIDIQDKAVGQHLEKVYTSTVIEKKVQEISNMIGFPKNHVFPVKNYEDEMLLDDGVNILALLALRQILYFAEDYIENQRSEVAEGPEEERVDKSQMDLSSKAMTPGEHKGLRGFSSKKKLNIDDDDDDFS
ncbi:interferon-induced protein 44-like isoform X2 [Dreissena polymorpha]|nr:interferon-induced protein 44-like isoform X2 [Dreissena polymorpha]